MLPITEIVLTLIQSGDVWWNITSKLLASRLKLSFRWSFLNFQQDKNELLYTGTVQNNIPLIKVYFYLFICRVCSELANFQVSKTMFVRISFLILEKLNLKIFSILNKFVFTKSPYRNCITNLSVNKTASTQKIDAFYLHFVLFAFYSVTGVVWSIKSPKRLCLHSRRVQQIRRK